MEVLLQKLPDGYTVGSQVEVSKTREVEEDNEEDDIVKRLASLLLQTK
jgi:hypothetical protein